MEMKYLNDTLIDLEYDESLEVEGGVVIKIIVGVAMSTG